MPVDPGAGYKTFKPRKKKTTPAMPSGFDNQGGTFTSGGFVPNKVKVPLPPDQAPYKHGQSPAQQGARAVVDTGEAVGTQHAHKAAQTMAIQRMLVARGANISVDGQWGPRTEAAYQAYLHHAYQATQAEQHLDPRRNPAYQEGPHVPTAHERLLIQQAQSLRGSPEARPAQTEFSDTKRYKPRFEGEPIAGYDQSKQGEPGAVPRPVGRIVLWMKPYYTESHTHESTRGEVAAMNETTNFEAMFGKQTEQDLEQSPRYGALGHVIEGVAGALPLAGLVHSTVTEGKPLTGHALRNEAINDLLWLGPNEIAAPFKITKGVVTAARSGEDLGLAAKKAVALWKEKRLARVENPIIRRDLHGSPDRASFVDAIQQAPGLTNGERTALTRVADHNALVRSAQTGEKPSIAWGKANFGKATFHDINPTRDEALGALAQTEGTHFQQAPLTSFPKNRGSWENPEMLKRASREATTSVGGFEDVHVRVPFVSKLHELVFDMPPKVGVQELLGKIKSAGIKQDEIKWNRFDTFLKEATDSGSKSVTREEALGWLDRNYLQIEENRRFAKNESGSYAHSNESNSDTTKFGNYTLPGGNEANYQEFTIRLPRDQYGELYSYTGHFPDANILAHVRATDRTVAEDHTLMIEEIQSDWHQAGQKQGYSMPVEEHPDYPARSEALRQAQLDAEAIAKRIRQTITDSVFNHPSLPGIPEALRPAFERGGETSIGLNLTDTHSVRDFLDHMNLIETELKVNPEARAEVRTIPGRTTGYHNDSGGFDVAMNGQRIDGPWYQYISDAEQTAKNNADLVASNFNRLIDMRPADREALTSHVEAYRHALADQREKMSLMNALQQDANRGVGNAPFQKTWHELAFKRMLAEAVDKGYERIAWTTGRTQAERYNLANFFKKIEIQEARGYSGSYSDELYQWADDMATSSVDNMSDEDLGLDTHREEQLRESAAEYEIYPSEEDFYVKEDENGNEVPANQEDEGAYLDEAAWDDAISEYDDNVNSRYDDMLDSWRDDAREAMHDSERDYYMENSHEYDAPSTGDLLVQATDHNGHTHEYTASRSGEEDNALENVIGPDLAKQYYESGQSTFEGDNLVAGENAKSALGASHFYDNKLTGFVNKYLKQTGVRSSLESIGGPGEVFNYRLDLRNSGGEHRSWVLEGNADYPISNYWSALQAQADRFHDIPRASVIRASPAEIYGTGEMDQRLWVKWSDFPAGAKKSEQQGIGPNDPRTFYDKWGADVWGPYNDLHDAEVEVENSLIHQMRIWRSVPGGGTIVHSIPVTDEVRKFVDQGIVLFQRDPLVREIKKAQRVKGAVQLGGEKATLHLFRGADASTVVHEIGHVVQSRIPALAHLDPEEFARSFERYFMTAKAPTKGLKMPFAEIDQALRRVYGAAEKIPGAKLTSSMKLQLDKFFKTVEKDHLDVYTPLSVVHFQADGTNDPIMVDAAIVEVRFRAAKGEPSDQILREVAAKYRVSDAFLRRRMTEKGDSMLDRILSNRDVGAGNATTIDTKVITPKSNPNLRHVVGTTPEGEQAGHITYYKNGDGTWTVQQIRVPEHLRRQGFGKQLFRAAERDVGDGKLLHQTDPNLLSPEGEAFKGSFDRPANAADVRKGMNEPLQGSGPGEPYSDIHLQEGEVPEEIPAAEEAAAPTPEETLRKGMRGVAIRRGLQKRQRSEELSRRAAAFERSLQSGHGLEGYKAALGELKGKLPQIDYHGFQELDGEALDHLINVVRDHPHLMPFQKGNLIDALDKATRGVLPTPSEQRLIEHVFGKDVANAFKDISGWDGHALQLLAEVLNVPRSVMASFDLSAPFRQGLVLGARHPRLFFKNFHEMFRAFGSERSYQEIMTEVKQRPTFPMMEDGGLAITDMESLDRREEQFYSNLAERITGGTRSPIRMSGRAYTAFLVKLRADVFDHLIRVAEQEGIDVQAGGFLKDLCRYINAASGRGNLSKLQGAAPLLNTVFFSPRLLASRVDLLFAPITYARSDPFVRRQALVSMLHLYGAAGTLLGLASFLPGVVVNRDPRNADFAKIRFGNTRIDVLGGFQQPARLISQFTTGKIISSTTGDALALGPQGPGAVSRRDIVQRFFEGKLAPVPSVINDWMKGTNFQGQPFSWKKEATSHLFPLLAQDATDLYFAGHGGVNGVALALGGYAVGAWGVGIQTYGPKNPATKPTALLQKEAKKAGFPEPTKQLLIDVKHKAELDSLSQKHPHDPQGRLDAYLKYYADTTGNHQYDHLIGQKPNDDIAQRASDAIRASLIGPGLAQYEKALRGSLKAQGKKW